MASLYWRNAVWTDRSSLPDFQCTSSPKFDRRALKKVHPRPWEYEVQSVIRSMTPPFQPPLFMIVGEGKATGICAATVYLELDGPGFVELQYMAVSLACRHQGGGVADQQFAEVLRRLEERAMARGVETVQITSRIHPLNVASQRMALRAKMRHVKTYDNGVQEWATAFHVAVVGDEPSH